MVCLLVPLKLSMPLRLCLGSGFRTQSLESRLPERERVVPPWRIRGRLVTRDSDAAGNGEA